MMWRNGHNFCCQFFCNFINYCILNSKSEIRFLFFRLKTGVGVK